MTGTGVDAAASTPVAVPVGRTQLLDVDEVGGRVERTELPGGLRVLTETMPGVLSATLGIWVGVGSRDESPAVAGSSHFLEHLLFKGTTTRSALEIAKIAMRGNEPSDWVHALFPEPLFGAPPRGGSVRGTGEPIEGPTRDN